MISEPDPISFYFASDWDGKMHVFPTHDPDYAACKYPRVECRRTSSLNNVSFCSECRTFYLQRTVKGAVNG